VDGVALTGTRDGASLPSWRFCCGQAPIGGALIAGLNRTAPAPLTRRTLKVDVRPSVDVAAVEVAGGSLATGGCLVSAAGRFACADGVVDIAAVEVAGGSLATGGCLVSAAGRFACTDAAVDIAAVEVAGGSLATGGCLVSAAGRFACADSVVDIAAVEVAGGSLATGGCLVSAAGSHFACAGSCLSIGRNAVTQGLWFFLLNATVLAIGFSF